MDTPQLAFKRILETLERLKIPYCIVGSVASSVHGAPRTTMDIDLVADVRVDQLRRLAAELKGEFYADPDMMEKAWEHGRAFNLIHLGSSHKIDVFPLGADPYSQEAFARRQLSKTAESIECSVATAEDTILSKLCWYRAGGEASERQWNDVRGIVVVAGARLDRGYLDRWAARLGVADLLDRLLQELPQK
jgi:hypothetical protein